MTGHESPGTAGFSPSAYELQVLRRAGRSASEATTDFAAGTEPYRLEEHQTGQQKDQSQQQLNSNSPLRTETNSSDRRLWQELPITVSQIARLGACHASNVTHWRNRSDFPPPISGGRSPLFRADSVIEWFQTEGSTKKVLVHNYETHLLTWAWQHAVHQYAIGRLGARAPRDEQRHIRAFLASLAFIVHTNAQRIPTAPTPDQIRAYMSDALAGCEIDGQSILNTQQTSLATAGIANDIADLIDILYALVRRGISVIGVVEDALESFDQHDDRESASHRDLAWIIATLAATTKNVTILDPASGEVELLLHLAKRCTGSTRLIGTDSDPKALQIARIRAASRNLDLDLRLADMFASECAPLADIVVLDPPQTKKIDLESWIKRAVELLAEGGRAYVLVPASALGPRGAITAALATHHVEAIIYVSRSIYPATRGKPAVVVLRKAAAAEQITLSTEQQNWVFLADLSDVATMRNGAAAPGNLAACPVERAFHPGVPEIAEILKEFRTTGRRDRVRGAPYGLQYEFINVTKPSDLKLKEIKAANGDRRQDLGLQLIDDIVSKAIDGDPLEHVSVFVYRPTTDMTSDQILSPITTSARSVDSFRSGCGATGQAWSGHETLVVIGDDCHNGAYGLTPEQVQHYKKVVVVGSTPIRHPDGSHELLGVVTAATEIMPTASENEIRQEWAAAIEELATDIAIVMHDVMRIEAIQTTAAPPGVDQYSHHM